MSPPDAELAPGKGPAQSAYHERLAHDGTSPAGCEWRISWRRSGWLATSHTKSRVFARRHAAERFLARLTGDGRPDLSPPTIEVHERLVGPWVTRPVDDQGSITAGVAS